MTSTDQAAREPSRRVRRVDRGRRRDDQRGIVLVWMALSLVVMLMFAAFMVDLGSWYRQSQDLQRTADAAGLAGATYLPDSPGHTGTYVASNPGAGICPANWLTSGVADATCAALKTVVKNGYPNANVTVAVDPGNNRQLDITVSQGNIQQYFTSFFMGPITFSRSSLAQFSQPVDLGSPQNYYGMGTLLGYTGFSGGTTPNFWASIAGYCYPKEGGDEYASGFENFSATNFDNHNGSQTLGGSFPTDCAPKQDTRINNTPATCDTSSHENCEFDSLGYEYVINVPAGLSQNPHIYVFNEGFDPCANQPEYSGGSLVAAPNPPYSAPLMDNDSNFSTQYPCGAGGPPAGATTFRTYYTLSGPTGGLGTKTASTSYSLGYPGWSDLTSQLGGSIGSGLPAGTYYLNVSTIKAGDVGNVLTSTPTNGDTGPSFGLHNYGLLVSTKQSTPSSSLTDGASYVCTTAPCPTIYANTSTAEAATIVSPGGTSTATAYLADVPTEAVGKLVTIKLWDVGDFAQYIQLIRPDGTVLGNESTNPTSISYAVYGADPDNASDYPSSVEPGPNNTPATSGTLSGCLDNTQSPAVTFAGSTGPCFPVNGCTPLNDTTNTQIGSPPFTSCGSEISSLGTSAWGAPNNRFGPSRYSDALVELSFIAPVSGWYGIAETTNASQVHDTITLNLLINGLPPHLTP